MECIIINGNIVYSQFKRSYNFVEIKKRVLSDVVILDIFEISENGLEYSNEKCTGLNLIYKDVKYPIIGYLENPNKWVIFFDIQNYKKNDIITPDSYINMWNHIKEIYTYLKINLYIHKFIQLEIGKI